VESNLVLFHGHRGRLDVICPCYDGSPGVHTPQIRKQCLFVLTITVEPVLTHTFPWVWVITGHGFSKTLH